MCVLVGTAACIFQSCLFGLGVRRTFSHGQFVRAYGFTGQPGGGHDPGGPLEGQRPHALLGGGLLWECHLLAPSAGGLQREVPASASVNLFHPCPAGCCLHSLSAQEQQTYAWLRAGLCALVRQRYPKARYIAANPVVLEWQARNCRRFFVVAFSTLAWSMVSRSNLVLRFVRLSFEGRSLFFGPYGPFVVHPRVV